MLDAQMAGETVKTGFNLALDGASIGLIVTNVFMLLRMKRSTSNGQRPGYTEKCIEHEKKLAQLETRELINYDNVNDMKEDLDQIREKIDRIYLLIGGKVDKS